MDCEGARADTNINNNFPNRAGCKFDIDVRVNHRQETGLTADSGSGWRLQPARVPFG